MASADVIVVGLGGMGSAASFHLARRGARVLGLDRFSPPHEQGSSHGHTRVIRQAYFEHSAYVPLLLRAYEHWRELEERSGERILLITGGLMMGDAGAAVVEGSLRSAREHGLRHEMLTGRELRRRYPLFQLHESTQALFEPSAGLVFCEEAVKAHLAAARLAGADLRFGEPVSSWGVEAGGGVVVETPQGRHTAAQLVLAPGAWAPELISGLGMPLTVERQVMFWFRPAVDTSLFAPGRFPVYIWQHADGILPYGFPAVDAEARGVKVALYRKPVAEVCTPETVDREVREADIKQMRDVLHEFLPALDGELVSAKVCLYTMTPDSNFVVGAHPEHPQVKVAAGFSGHGFKFCSVMGEIVADLVTSGGTKFDIGLFDPRRRV